MFKSVFHCLSYSFRKIKLLDIFIQRSMLTQTNQNKKNSGAKQKSPIQKRVACLRWISLFTNICQMQEKINKGEFLNFFFLDQSNILKCQSIKYASINSQKIIHQNSFFLLRLKMGICNSNQQNKQKEIKQIIQVEQPVPKNSNKETSKNFENFECLFFDQYQFRWLKKKCYIECDQDNQLIYLYNGYMVRLMKKFSLLENEVFNNLEQIKYIEWVGNFENLRRVSKWKLNWNGQILQNVGGYYSKSGQKQGIWKDIMKNFCSKVLVFEVGQMEIHLQQQNNVLYKNKIYQISGGGYYNQQSQKTGNWSDLSDEFWDENQIIYNGYYNNQGIKVGRWNIVFKEIFKSQNKYIGGGQYYCSQGTKIGRWVELWEGFKYEAKVIYLGEYNLKGIKIGRWDIMYCRYNEQEYKQIGGGTYDSSSGIKMGKWVELWEAFWRESQVTYIGEYNNKGIKVGRWDFQFISDFDQITVQIGGGSYDSTQGFKIGSWVELDEGFNCFQNVTNIGDYNKNGLKAGRWNIFFKSPFDQEYKKIGGGIYDSFSGIKIGKWIEQDERFVYEKQVTYNGEYNINSMKIGRWDIMYDKKGNGEYNQMLKLSLKFLSGGGSYNTTTGIKIGRWVELWEGFQYSAKVTYVGEYNLKGMKVDKWDIMYELDKIYKQIGFGMYDCIYGIKIGRWVELDEKFLDGNQIIYYGDYNDKGMKVGKWVETDLKINKQCGEINYEN
ncbi:unnamed protein product [Paramecium sonneborni]|uniref:Uncharacterized protein n=1 Tax=Paramecium sonneborni TaxID=65129 RepID=A0A8S1QJP9_9CILI|nr:unnamed protein product [Paramecium sonneborni]